MTAAAAEIRWRPRHRRSTLARVTTPPLDADILTPVARAALGDDRAVPTAWRVRRLGTGLHSPTSGVYVVSGTAHAPGGAPTWRVALKVLRPPADVAAHQPEHFRYWRRELLAYRSGLLDDLPGRLTAPRCLAATEGPGEVAHLWLTAVAGTGRWSAGRLAAAAHRLGGFGGAWAAGRTRPDVPWLSRGQLRRRVQRTDSAGGLPLLVDPAAWRHPTVADLVGGRTAAALAEVWAARHALLSRLGELPQTLCHGDFHRGNLLTAPRQTTVLDWATVGFGPLGADLADLWLGEVATERGEPGAVAERLYASYIAGLREAGWRGDPAAPRVGFTATAALAGTSRLHWSAVQLFSGRGSAATVRGFLRAGPVLEAFAQEAVAG